MNDVILFNPPEKRLSKFKRIRSKSEFSRKQIEAMDSHGRSTSPSLCVKGCGFFGTAETRNMCSKCFKDYLKDELLAKSRSVETASPRIETQKSSSTANAISVESQEKAERRAEEASSKAKNRCRNCNKKVGFTGFTCRCGKLFCGTHRYPEEHSCTFDFKKADRQVLAKQIVLVKADKLGDRI